MKKRNYWPLFFIGIFSFVFYMIIWTIVQSTKAPVIEDKSFMQKYQYVDEHYNTMMKANQDFLSKYDLVFSLNGVDFGLTTQDIKYGQRVIEKYSEHKNILKVGENTLKLIAKDKKTSEKYDLNIELLVTKTMTNDNDLILLNKDFKEENKEYLANFKILEETNWNITGKLTLNDSKGYIFIKTNAR